jgi:hypothetical protein
VNYGDPYREVPSCDINGQPIGSEIGYSRGDELKFIQFVQVIRLDNNHGDKLPCDRSKCMTRHGHFKKDSMIRAYPRPHFKVLPYLLRNHPLKNTRSIFRQLSGMSVQQPPWSAPTKQTEEPVLRVYNSLTKTKVQTIFYNLPSISLPFRTSSFHVMVAMSSGTIAVQQCTMPPTWVTPGKSDLFYVPVYLTTMK